MIFITDQLYLSLHWSGDTDFEDTRIWIQKVIDDEKAEPVLVYNSFEMASFTPKQKPMYHVSPKKEANKTDIKSGDTTNMDLWSTFCPTNGLCIHF